MKQNYSSFAGQMQLNARAGRIAELNALNNLIRAIDPSEAWDTLNIAYARDLDALQDQIIACLVRVQAE